MSFSRAQAQKSQKMSRLSLRSMIVLAVLAGMGVFLKASPLSVQAPTTKQTASLVDLDSILKKLADYCLRLENAAFDFVCLEEIKETINPALDVNRPRETLKDWAYWDYQGWKSGTPKPLRKIKNVYLYDYQCIRANREMHEMRMLLEENGKKKKEPNALLKTAVVVYGNALLGPVGLFGKRFQSRYDYKSGGKEMIDGRPVFVIDVMPRAGVPETRSLYGKAWIDKETLDILKIEWSERHIGRYEIFTKRGELYKRTPRLTVRSEFKAEKNGIRFPSSLFIEEAYLNNKSRAAVRSITTVAYKDFRFFTVEVEIR
jgi:hypothetical protein